MEDVLKTAAEGVVGAVAVGVAAIWVVGTVLVCAVSCALSFIFDAPQIEACFDRGFSGARETLSDAAETISNVEQESFIAVSDSPNVLSHNGTSFFHFMNTPVDYQSLADELLAADPTGLNLSPFEFFSALFEHDDIDGYRAGEAFGVWGGVITQGLFEGLWLDQIVDIRVSFKRSKHSILNYQIINSDDAPNTDSSTFPTTSKPLRNVFYWQRMGLTDYTFPPVDNLAYYWWHVWWESRSIGQQRVEELGLLPLGAVLHAVQDITQPLHARGITLHGHQSYEEDVDNRMDHTMMLLNRADMRAPLLIDLSTNLGQKNFIKSVIRKFLLLYNISVNKEGVLDIRKLMHTLYLISQNIDEDVFSLPDWTGDWKVMDIVQWSFSLGLKALITDDYSSNQGLPYAIAATMLVLLEASRDDINVYENGLNLTNFRNYMVKNDKYFDDEGGTWSNLRTNRQTLQGAPKVSYIDEPEQVPEVWQCAGDQPAVKRAVEDYIADRMNGRDVLKVVMSAYLACEIQEVGLPMPPNSYLERVAKLKVGELESRLMLLSHGDVQRYHKEMSCLHKEEWDTAPSDERYYDDARYQQLAARCGDTLDSDGDGVLDQDDQCYTPSAVLRSPGVTVNASGCAFDHAYKRGQRLPSLDMPGAKVIRRQP